MSEFESHFNTLPVADDSGQESVEKRAESATKYLLSLCGDKDFRKELVVEVVRKLREVLDKESKKSAARTSQMIKVYSDRAKEETGLVALELARDRFGGDVKYDLSSQAAAAKTLRAEWGKVQAEVLKKWKTKIGDREMSIDEISVEITEKNNAELAAFVKELNEKIAESEKHTLDLLDALKVEVEKRRGEPEVIEAINTWGLSPDSKDGRGDGKGFNAGIAHFFEYRREKSKSGRFSEGHEMTLDAFVKFSKQLKELISNPNPATNADIQDVLYLKDELGQHRLMILTKKGMFVSAFQEKDQPMRVITGNQKYDVKGWAKDVKDEFDPEKTKARLNQLGKQREQIDIAQYGKI